MKAGINEYMGISRARLLSSYLIRSGFTQSSLAQQAGEHYQSVNAVVKGRRKLTIGQAIEIERVLGLDEGFLMMLQTMHEIELFKNNMRKSSGLPPNIRRILF